MDQLRAPAPEHWLRAVLLACAVLLTLRAVGSVVYNVFFHPLSGVPGPLLCKVSRLPHWVACLRGEQVRIVKKWHDKYGAVVRYGPDELSYTDAQAWKDICAHQKGRPENLKAPHFHLEALGSDSAERSPSLLTAKTAQHARVRRLFSPAFSDRALKQQEPLFSRYADLLGSRVRAARGEPVNVTLLFNLVTFDTMAEFAFGEALGLLEGSKYTAWVESIIRAFKGLPVLQLISSYPWLNKCFELLEPRVIKENRLGFFANCADRVNKRLEKGSDQPDLWNFLEPSTESGERLSVGEMHSNSITFMAAGSETTAALLTALSYLLLTHPAKFEILKKEVRDQATSPAGLNFETLASLKYLNACLQEALRLFPPIPVGIPRVVDGGSDGGQVICGRWVPAGTSVSVHQYAAYRSSENFKDPEEFVPERWLGGGEFKDDSRDAAQPFSYGPRNCLGQNMAWHEMRIFFGTLVSKFDMELCEESRGWAPVKVYVIWDKKPLLVRFESIEV